MTLYNKYVEHSQKIADISYATGLLHWDQECYMPTKGAVIRARQLATLSGIVYDLQTEDAFGPLLYELQTDHTLDELQAKNVALSLKDYEREKPYNKEFVMRKSTVISTAYQAWLKAREAQDFSIYKEPLGAMVAIKLEEAEL